MTGSHWDPPYWATLLIGQKSTITTDVEEFPEARCVEVVQLLGMALVYCPCFTYVEQRGEHYCPVQLQLGL